MRPEGARPKFELPRMRSSEPVRLKEFSSWRPSFCHVRAQAIQPYIDLGSTCPYSIPNHPPIRFMTTFVMSPFDNMLR